jgi:hypothetical protein
MSLAVRNGSMASLYALRGQVSWSCWRRDADERCGHGRKPDGCQAEGIVVVLDGLEPVWVVVLSLERRYRGLTTVGENDGLEWADGLDGRVGEWCWRTTRGVR